MTRAEVARLVGRARRGDPAAVAELVERNQGLMARVVYKYVRRGHHHDFNDLMQTAVVGLLRGLARFDPARGVPFASYAMHWVRAEVAAAMTPRQLTTEGARKAWRQSAAAANALRARGEEPTREAVAAHIGVDVKYVERVQQVNYRVASLDAPVSADVDATLADVIPDAAERADERLEREDLVGEARRVVRAALRVLDRRERDVVLRRHLADAPETLEQVGRSMGVSRECVRRVEVEALAKMRAAAGHRGAEVVRG